PRRTVNFSDAGFDGSRRLNSSPFKPSMPGTPENPSMWSKERFSSISTMTCLNGFSAIGSLHGSMLRRGTHWHKFCDSHVKIQFTIERSYGSALRQSSRIERGSCNSAAASGLKAIGPEGSRAPARLPVLPLGIEVLLQSLPAVGIAA